MAQVQVQVQEVLAFKAEIRIRYHEKYCFLGHLRYPAELFLPPEEEYASTLILSPQYTLEPGMQLIEDRPGFQRCIRSTDPEKKKEFFVPVIFFMERRARM
jgi:hypothetical protein